MKVFLLRSPTRLFFRTYRKLKPVMNRLEIYTNGIDNTERFHRKYGKGERCMITNCKCKATKKSP